MRASHEKSVIIYQSSHLYMSETNGVEAVRETILKLYNTIKEIFIFFKLLYAKYIIVCCI